MFFSIQVLDRGQICEFDSPYLLLQNTNGLFHQMALQTGSSEFEQLQHTARKAHNKLKIQPKEVDVVLQDNQE